MINYETKYLKYGGAYDSIIPSNNHKPDSTPSSISTQSLNFINDVYTKSKKIAADFLRNKYVDSSTWKKDVITIEDNLIKLLDDNNYMELFTIKFVKYIEPENITLKPAEDIPYAIPQYLLNTKKDRLWYAEQHYTDKPTMQRLGNYFAPEMYNNIHLFINLGKYIRYMFKTLIDNQILDEKICENHTELWKKIKYRESKLDYRYNTYKIIKELKSAFNYLQNIMINKII